MSYLLYVLTVMAIFAILAISLNLLVGYSGIFSVAQAAFFGVGAYTSAIMSMKLGVPFLGALVIAVAFAALVSAAISIPFIRVSGDYFVVASFGVQVILYDIFVNFEPVTRGPAGMFGIPPAELLGYRITSAWAQLTMVVAALAVVSWGVVRLDRSPFGRVLRMIREDETLALVYGKNVVRVRIAVTALSGALAGLSGSLYAHTVGFIDPYTFALGESIFVLAIVILGGLGNLFGSIVGAVVLLGLPEMLKFAAIPETIFAPARQMLYGLLLIAFMFVRPRGFFAELRGVRSHTGVG